MRIQHGFAMALAAVVSLVGFQSLGFAGTASHEGTLHGHVRTFGPHHHPIQQPDPPKQSIPTVNVRDFGAKGDGVTDDTGAIQNAIAFAQGSGEGVLFPAGTYLHTSIIYDNGVPLIGVGGASVLLANNPNASSVVLTGMSPSIQNMVVNSAPASTGILTFLGPFSQTVTVQNSQNFVVQGITIVNGSGRTGVLLLQSAVGQISGVTFNGTGPFPVQNYGVIMDSCSNVSLVGNLFLNEGIGIDIGQFSSFVNNSIAVISNTVNAANLGILAQNVVTLDVAQNQVQVTGPFALGISVSNGNNYFVANNSTAGGINGINVANGPGLAGTVSQNIIRNVSGDGVTISTGSVGNVQFIANQFGEIGLVSGSVISVTPGGPDTVTLLNNVYAGHQNSLTDFIFSTAHLNLVSGNTQTQTALPNSIP